MLSVGARTGAVQKKNAVVTWRQRVRSGAEMAAKSQNHRRAIIDQAHEGGRDMTDASADATTSEPAVPPPYLVREGVRRRDLFRLSTSAKV